MKIVWILSSLLLSSTAALACPENSRCLPSQPGAVAPRYEETTCKKNHAKYASIFVRIDSSETGYITIEDRNGEGDTLNISHSQLWDYTKQIVSSDEEGTVIFTYNKKSKEGTLMLVNVYGRLTTVAGYKCQ